MGVSGPALQTLAEAEKEIGRLRAELIRMREREIVLKKSVGILSETPESGMPRLRRHRPGSGRESLVFGRP